MAKINYAQKNVNKSYLLHSSCLFTKPNIIVSSVDYLQTRMKMRKSSPYICMYVQYIRAGLHILSCMNDAWKIKDLKIFVHLALIGSTIGSCIEILPIKIGILVVTAHLSMKTCLLDSAKSYRNLWSLSNICQIQFLDLKIRFCQSLWLWFCIKNCIFCNYNLHRHFVILSWHL